MDDLHRENEIEASDIEHVPVREPLLNIPGVIVGILALLVIIQLLISYVFNDYQINDIYYYGGFIPTRYGGELSGEWLAAIFSPVTYSLLHGGWEHLIFNAIWLVAFGSPVAARMGALRFLLFWIVTSVVGAFVFAAFNMHSMALLVGASGAISGLTAAACRFVWAGRGLRHPETYMYVERLSIVEAVQNRQVLIFTAFWFLANVVLAAGGVFSPEQGQAVAWEAHLGGFIAGFLLFPLFDPVRYSGGSEY